MPIWTRRLEWLSPNSPRNPHNFEVLDCREGCLAFAQAIEIEHSADAEAALNRFAQSSASQDIVRESLNSACMIELQIAKDPSALFEAAASDAGHRWRLEYVDGRVFARRRRTGQLVHIIELEIDGRQANVRRVTSQSTYVYRLSEYAVAEIEFVLRTYLEGATPPFPIPPGLTYGDETRIAIAGWKAHGSIAKFARFLQMSFTQEATPSPLI